jgi:hypothetical protein
MIIFETDNFPISMDEYICDRDVVVEYDFDDHGLIFTVYLRDKDGIMEDVDHLLSSSDNRFFLKLIAEKEHQDYINAQEEIAIDEYESRRIR